MRFNLLAAVACLVLVFSGLVHGLWTQRWRTAPAIAEAVAKLQRVPEAIGSWRGRTLDQDPRELTLAGYAGLLRRRYDDARTGRTVSVLLVCGRPGPVCVHTPDACYGGIGYTMVGEPTATTFRLPALSGPAHFWRAHFALEAATSPRRLRIYWAWYAGDRWEAADNPRLAFAHLPALCKLYVVCETDSANEQRERDACTDFMPQLLPEIHKAFAAPAAARDG